MKKIYKKPAMEIHSCDLGQLKGDITAMSDKELEEQLRKCGYFKEKKYRSSKNYILREIAGETVLVSIGDGIADFCGIVRLNSSAKILWEAIEQPKSKKELARILQETFGIEEEKAAEDTERSLNILEEHGMLVYE